MPIVIDIRAEQPDFSPMEKRGKGVQKIVIGESPTDTFAKAISVPGLPEFEDDFTELTHLFLWNTTDLKSIPALPARLSVLEIRSSRNLDKIVRLPASLESIVIEDCPELKELPPINQTRYMRLRELSLAGCCKIDQDWIHDLINAAPNLLFLDLSRCEQIERLPGRLPALDRLELNGCTNLSTLSSPLPLSLRRLGLRDASSLKRIPDLGAAIDYVDLAFTKRLNQLPKFPSVIRGNSDRGNSGSAPAMKPRTLFLFGSGVMEPPSSEHGADSNENVATVTRDYQYEVELVGRGTVKRCKLLLLGNGSAGKTFLALNLNPHFNIESHYPGSTHGIQFWDWPDYEAKGDESNPIVHLHMWDFGGQEIYHSTHRLFVSRGSVFVVVWDPGQDGKQPVPVDGYRDVWFPIRYWLDYIHAECPHHQPKVAVVCSHQSEKWKPGENESNVRLKTQLREKLRIDIGDEYLERIDFFVLDSQSNIGERRELESWLGRSVAEVVETQGTIVPTYWEIAQNMVEKWLTEKRKKAKSTGGGTDSIHAGHSRLTFDEFRDRFAEAIREELVSPDRFTDFSMLRKQWNDGEFLTDARVKRTLRFLTHSGWLYWSTDLFESRVIIDQPWALDKIYACLNRKPGTFIYKKLDANKGKFTFSHLREWHWNDKDLDESDQKLIMSFMESVGVCFPLRRRWYRESSNTETTYISPTHLPESNEMANAFDLEGLDQTEETVKSPQLHRGVWFSILKSLCSRYGEEGTYARDACLIRGSSRPWNNEDDKWLALIRFVLDNPTKGLGGKISISVTGSGVTDHLGALKEFVESFMPGYKGKPSDAVSKFDQEFHHSTPKPKTVFFSYAWDPDDPDKKGFYEEAVDAVYDALVPFEKAGILRLLRDKKSMSTGDYITRFIQNAGNEDVDLVLVFSSDKYWRSWFCMAEFEAMISSLTGPGKSFQETVRLIEHELGKLHVTGDEKPIIDHWKNLELVELGEATYPKEFPLILKNVKHLDWRSLRDSFVNLIQAQAPTITSNAVGLRKQWSAAKSAEIVTWIKEKLELPEEA